MPEHVDITRSFTAPPERVWAAMTDPDLLASWFWPAWFATSVSADARVGGEYRIASDVAEMAVAGHYRTVEPPGRLAMSWRWDGEDAESLVSVDLAAAAAGTEMRLRQHDLVDETAREQHVQGWNDCLDRLVSHLGGQAEEG